MSKSRYTEAEIIAVLKQVEAGRKVEEVAREAGVSKHTIYAWKAKYGGMESERSARSEAVAGREWVTQEAGGGFKFGQGCAAVGDPKKTGGARSPEGGCRASARGVCLQPAASLPSSDGGGIELPLSDQAQR